MGTQSSTESVEGGYVSGDAVDDMLKVNQPTGYKQSIYNIVTTSPFLKIRGAGYSQRRRQTDRFVLLRV